MKRITREIERGNCWTERDFGGRRVYLCWHVGVGAMGQRTVRRTLIGRAALAGNQP